MKNMICSPAEARRIAMEYAGLTYDDSRCLRNVLEDGFYEIVILTPFQKVEIYVDAQTDEVSGFNCRFPADGGGRVAVDEEAADGRAKEDGNDQNCKYFFHYFVSLSKFN